MKALLLLALSLAAVGAVPFNSQRLDDGSVATNNHQRIVGGSVTTISRYPMAVSMLYGAIAIFLQSCGGSIINNRSILSAAHCYSPRQTAFWRSRVGSTSANLGGVVHHTQSIINHPQYNDRTNDNDVSVIRIVGTFTFNNNVRAAAIAGTNLNVPDNAAVWVIGWGTTSPGGIPSEALRHVQVWTVNQATCASRYRERGRTITANMLCAGWLDVGGRDACQGDSGGPLLLNNVVVGITSWGASCAMARFPGVYARVSRFTTWIQNNA